VRLGHVKHDIIQSTQPEVHNVSQQRRVIDNMRKNLVSLAVYVWFVHEFRPMYGRRDRQTYTYHNTSHTRSWGEVYLVGVIQNVSFVAVFPGTAVQKIE